jgi:hypothetical protein
MPSTEGKTVSRHCERSEAIHLKTASWIASGFAFAMTSLYFHASVDDMGLPPCRSIDFVSGFQPGAGWNLRRAEVAELSVLLSVSSSLFNRLYLFISLIVT